MEESRPIQINLQQVLDDKLGSKARYVPRAVVRWLERTVRQDQLNEILRINHPKTGAEFCDGVFDYLDVEVNVLNPAKLPDPAHRRVIFVSNHPLGGLDGMAIISRLSKIYGGDIRFVVNDLLMAVVPLRDVFLPINKHGRQDRAAIADINQAMASDMPIVVFPAGLVSRMGKGGDIRDLQWNKMFVNKAVEYRRDVVPLYFSGRNTMHFYRLAKWRKTLGVKFNIEMVYLPSEMLKARGGRYDITVGDTIPWQTLRNGPEALDQAAEIKEIVYNLKRNPS